MADMTITADFEMYTDAGNAAVQAMCDGLIARMRSGELQRNDLEKAIEAGCQAVAKTPRPEGDETTWGDPIDGTFNEVYDTEPQWGIAGYMSKACEDLGWKPVSRWDW